MFVFVKLFLKLLSPSSFFFCCSIQFSVQNRVSILVSVAVFHYRPLSKLQITLSCLLPHFAIRRSLLSSLCLFSFSQLFWDKSLINLEIIIAILMKTVLRFFTRCSMLKWNKGFNDRKQFIIISVLFFLHQVNSLTKRSFLGR